jgi:serine protease Do
MEFIKTFLVRGALFMASAAVLLTASQGVSQTLRLNPIKPTVGPTAQTVTITDEQQAILAVRQVKPAVVSVVGSVGLADFAPGSVDTSFGTGFIIESNGYIITNNHVVDDPKAEYNVILLDGQRFPARVVGFDSYYDIALLKIEAVNLATVPLGNSDALETGQTVFAIGNSLGKYQHTVSKGVVSGLGRSISPGTQSDPKPRLQNLIQTDAAINPGNSGGPLVNMSGQVIGMNTAVDRDGEGVGFAIPVNVFKESIQQMKSSGKVSRPYIGLNFVTITRSVQATQRLTQSQGAYVITVVAGSPAARAGIQPNDIIIAIDRQTLSERTELDQVIQRYQAGNQVMITLLRAGKELQLPVILGEYTK